MYAPTPHTAHIHPPFTPLASPVLCSPLPFSGDFSPLPSPLPAGSGSQGAFSLPRRGHASPISGRGLIPLEPFPARLKRQGKSCSGATRRPLPGYPQPHSPSPCPATPSSSPRGRGDWPGGDGISRGGRPPPPPLRPGAAEPCGTERAAGSARTAAAPLRTRPPAAADPMAARLACCLLLWALRPAGCRCSAGQGAGTQPGCTAEPPPARDSPGPEPRGGAPQSLALSSIAQDMVAVHMLKLYEKYNREGSRPGHGNTVRSFKGRPGKRTGGTAAAAARSLLLRPEAQGSPRSCQWLRGVPPPGGLRSRGERRGTLSNTRTRVVSHRCRQYCPQTVSAPKRSASRKPPQREM